MRTFIVLKERSLQTSPPFIFSLYTIDPIYDKVLEACSEGVALHGIRVMDQKMKVKIILEENQVAISQTFVTSRFFLSQFCDVAKLAIIHKMI